MISNMTRDEAINFRKCDKCKVVKNALSPKCVGHTVEIIGTIVNMCYKVRHEDGMVGYASEDCLGLIENKHEAVNLVFLTI